MTFAQQKQLVRTGWVAPGAVETITDDQSEDVRWENWKAKGRADDVRFQRRLRTVVIDVAAVIALGSAFWLAFQS